MGSLFGRLICKALAWLPRCKPDIEVEPQVEQVSMWERKPDWNERPPALIRRDLADLTEHCLRTRRRAVEAMRGRMDERRKRQCERGTIAGKENARDKKKFASNDAVATMGLALSGGGIRSATISLGIVQGLASKWRLLDFDYCSTVSGGGYCGSFLGALFMPDFARGDVPQDDPREGRRNDQPEDKARFALAALRHDPRQTECRFPINEAEDCDCEEQRVLNPVWWLREHSRYLAPSGMTDYLLGLATVMRNWLSMLYVLVLPIAVGALALCYLTWVASFSRSDLNKIKGGEYVEAVYEWVEQKQSTTPKDEEGTPIKPLPERIGRHLYPEAHVPSCKKDKCPPPSAPCPEKPCAKAPIPMPASVVLIVGTLPMLFCVAALGMAFWMTAYMSLDDRPAWRATLQWLWSSWWAFRTLALALVVGLGGLSYAIWTLALWKQQVAGTFSWLTICLMTFMAGWFVALLVALAAHRSCRKIWVDSRSTDAFTAAVRLRLTRWTAAATRVLLWTLVIAILDSLGRWTYLVYTDHKSEFTLGALAPAGAFLLSKVWRNVSQPSSETMRLLNRYFGIAMMICAVICYAALAVAVHVGVQHLIFDGRPWTLRTVDAVNVLGAGWIRVVFEFLCAAPLFEFLCAPWLDEIKVIELRFAILAGVLAAVGWFAGSSSAFINLSSLHSFYASRLTRAYLGAANIERLQDWVDPLRSAPITEAHPGDQIDVSSYQRSFAEGRNLAPMHLINVTLNETRSKDRSQVLERDRKGVPLVFAPEGMLINAGKELTDYTYHEWNKMAVAETLSVGQLCAISGAAASTGMGARTTLGTALAMTFANVRLGYWWSLNGLLTRRKDRAPEPPVTDMFKFWETYSYLGREMTARYNRGTRRVNISDGGHFENSGVYELLRRRVRTIVVADNGADKEFHFGDLEQLMRKTRLDLGVEVSVPDAKRMQFLLREFGLFDLESETGPDLASLFLNCTGDDWRRAAASRETDSGAPAQGGKRLRTAVPHGSAFCLLLEAQVDDVMHNGFEEDPYYGLIVWMKPRLFAGLTHDVAGYATGHPAFPHETTSDQFFDEAQWESYRKLGETMIDRLLGAEGEGRNDLFRKIAEAMDRHQVPPK